jgi:peptide/nickel transport system substrate-binding protein
MYKNFISKRAFLIAGEFFKSVEAFCPDIIFVCLAFNKRNSMRFSYLPIVLVPAFLLLQSCSDSPSGKFVDNSKDKPSSSSDSGLFIHNAHVTKWEKDWSTANTIVYQWKAEPDNLHPTNGKSNPRRVIMDYTQRFLVGTDYEKQGIRPDLIKALPTASADGLRFSYELRDEPTWDDGSPVTAEDVEFSLKAFVCPYTDDGYARPYFETISGFEKDPANPKKFTVVCSRKYIANVAVFGDVPIMQRKFHDPENVLSHYTVKELNDPAFANGKHPDLEAWGKMFNDPKYGRELNLLNGLGAYKVTTWESKQRLELTKKANHWTSKLKNSDMYDAAYPDKIIFKVVTDDNAINLELLQQSVDVSTWVSTHGLYELQKDTNFNRNYFSAFVPNFNWQYIAMNLKPEAANRPAFFTDVRVRHAMALLVPADKMNKDYLYGQALRMPSLVSPVKKKVINNDLKLVPYNVDSAKMLLDQAGWKDTDGDNIRDKMIDGKKVKFSFELLTMTGSSVSENMASDIKASMKLAGIEVTIKSLEFVAFYNQLDTRQFDMCFGVWGSSSGPEDYKQIWYSTSWDNKGSNFVGFSNAEADTLIDHIRNTVEDSLRIPMEKRLQKIVYDEQPYIFLYAIQTKTAIHKRFDHADMYFDKPGVYLSNLRAMNPGMMATTNAQ